MGPHANELAKAHAQLVALRDAIKASAREVNRILARIERAMRLAASEVEHKAEKGERKAARP